MTHYEQARQAIKDAEQVTLSHRIDADPDHKIAIAQVHATLAVAGWLAEIAAAIENK